jgi:hypothetical protein
VLGLSVQIADGLDLAGRRAGLRGRGRLGVERRQQLGASGDEVAAPTTAYSQKSGRAMVESTYATTVSGNTPGFTLPQLTASDGVAPDSPPQTT